SIGAFMDDRYWNVYMMDDTSLAWSWKDNQLVNPARRVLTRAQLSWSHIPTSKDSPGTLSAVYQANVPASAEAGQALKMQTQITNTGTAAFLSWPASTPGWTRLELHWEINNGRPLAKTSRLLRLRNDLLPGATQSYTTTMRSPDRAGSYELVVQLLID